MKCFSAYTKVTTCRELTGEKVVIFSVPGWQLRRICLQLINSDQVNLINYACDVPSVLSCCWFGNGKGIWPVKTAPKPLVMVVDTRGCSTLWHPHLPDHAAEGSNMQYHIYSRISRKIFALKVGGSTYRRVIKIFLQVNVYT